MSTVRQYPSFLKDSPIPWMFDITLPPCSIFFLTYAVYFEDIRAGKTCFNLAAGASLINFVSVSNRDIGTLV